MDVLSISIRRDQYLELEKIGIGALSPLDHFMTEDEFHSVCQEMFLPCGFPFTIPVVLDTDTGTAHHARHSSKIELIYAGIVVGEMIPESIYTCDKSVIAKQVYGVSDEQHPGVSRFFSMGDWFIGGKTTLLARVPSEDGRYEMTPSETRQLFNNLGWKTIVGFQTRNVPHRAHEYLQRVALEHVDGLFIQPLIGQKKRGDYTPDAIMTGYTCLIDRFYPKNRVVLGVLSTSMRYAGPREAVFHALIRKNYGCTHFIVGRDHAGVGNYYDKYAAHQLLRRFDATLGIQIMYLHGPYHCDICGGIVTEHTCPHGLSAPTHTLEISGTMIRKILVGGEKPDSRLIRPEIIEAVHGHTLFIENESD